MKKRIYKSMLVLALTTIYLPRSYNRSDVPGILSQDAARNQE